MVLPLTPSVSEDGRVRAARLLSVLLLLQNRGRLTATDLAAELEVSVRTVYRDVEALQAAGVPLYGEAGHAGGYRLIDGYRTRLTGLTADEAEALFLTGLPGPAAELGLGEVVAATRLKLAAALPPELRERSGRLAERFHLDAPSWYHDGEGSPWLAAVAGAVWGQRQIHIRYRRWRAPQEVSRTLHPYGLILKAGRWYLVAAADAQPRTYRISQILDLTVLDAGFDRPAGFDLAGYWRDYLADFEARRHHDIARIRLSPHGMRRLAQLMTPTVAAAARASAGPPDQDGWVTAELPIETLDHAASELLRLGADVEVLAPAALRAHLAGVASELARLYAVGQA